ncbi:twin-arginine translocation pathway signal [Mycolicibacter engbaekii]|uniref:Twin-arginine translocation pathway signal n=1 Tax=Mycolicibacter engbaekii TaxID=188915 RepID=A0A1X1T9G4_9MYCO|nr:twin-arginine translocation pathway signal [Mycolicibacter engbaekii]ORV41138.1 twin-arginine translocation pathway signal [Mycolicibacter engbaekii]
MSESDEAEVTVETSDDDAAPDNDRRSAPHSRMRLMAIGLAAALAVLSVLTCWLYLSVFRTDRQLGPEAEQAVLAAAAEGTTAVLTYSPKTLEKDFAAAESHLTGDFLAYYTDFTQKVVTPAAKQKDVQTAASVVRKGIVTLQPTTAEVLVFVNQTTVSKANPDGSFSMSSVKVGLQKHDGRWLIAAFDPV